jgi:hypothetical protein
MAADEKLNALRSGFDPRAVQTAELEAARRAQQNRDAQALANTTFKTAIEFYVANRNCAPVQLIAIGDHLQRIIQKSGDADTES